MGRLRSIANWLLYLLFLVLCVEFGVRAVVAFRMGSVMLLYGTPFHRDYVKVAGTTLAEDSKIRQVEVGRQAQAFQEIEDKDDFVFRSMRDTQHGYEKYPPSSQKFDIDVDTGERFIVHVNDRGFRGTSYPEEKPANTVRIVTLGASSTWGFRVRDHHTYPYQLEQSLNNTCQGNPRFEVVSLAIPHMRSDNIYSAFVSEGLAMNPDVVTFYEGRNDSRILLDELTAEKRKKQNIAASSLGAAQSYLKKYSLVVRFIEEWRDQRSKSTLNNKQLEQLAEPIRLLFMRNLQKIYDQTKEHDIYFIPITQQINSKAPHGFPEAERAKFRGLTYEAEMEAIRKKADIMQPLVPLEIAALTHSLLMQDLRNWANAESLPMIDFIKIMNNDRHQLISWVHLTPEGNGMLARAISSEVLEKYPCN